MLRSPDYPNSEVDTIFRNNRTCFKRLQGLAVVVLAVAALAISPLGTKAFGISEKTLTPVYRHWIHQEVNYIITRAERNEFLALKTDDERDKFIERFWELRNPSPGAPANSYKEDIYKPIEYANDHFPTNGSNDGWETDMGRIYIPLGPPQQKRSMNLSRSSS